MKIAPILPALGLSALLAAVPFASAQVTSSVQSGDWSDSATWDGSAPTLATEVRIVAGHTVTADTNISSVSGRLAIYGTLNVGEGVSIATSGRLNYNITSSGVLNINGGAMTVAGIWPATPVSSNFTINLSAGSFTTTDTVQLIGTNTTINVSGGTFNLASAGFSGGTALNLTGGAFIFTNGYTGNFNSALTNANGGSWNGGRVVTNTTSPLRQNALTNLLDALSTNSTNVWDLSNKTGRQVFTGDYNGLINVTKGIVEFDVYSSATNDNDQIVMNGGANARINFSSDVTFAINGVNLTGNASDYLGISYQLFDYEGDNYTGIVAILADTVWNIGGTDYTVEWTNNLASNGTLTVAGLTAVPEPATVALLGGAAIGLFVSLRRRR